jgi:hypothetical protein
MTNKATNPRLWVRVLYAPRHEEHPPGRKAERPMSVQSTDPRRDASNGQDAQ